MMMVRASVEMVERLGFGIHNITCEEGVMCIGIVDQRQGHNYQVQCKCFFHGCKAFVSNPEDFRWEPDSSDQIAFPANGG